MGENLKVVWAEFSTLSYAVLQNVYNSLPTQTQPSLDLKTQPRFRPVSLSFSMVHYNFERVENLTHNPKIEGSNAATGTGREKVAVNPSCLAFLST